MKEIIAYEMIYNKALKYHNDIIGVSFQKEYWNEYDVGVETINKFAPIPIVP